ncbi:thioredoxin domain containing protein [Gracilaria domingensis]|nr:thioredoxin domain containing protein [Gracilaria domingensis]
MPTFHFYRRGVKVSQFSGADQNRLQSAIEMHAPSAAEVAFAGSGNRLGSQPTSSGAPSQPPAETSDEDDMRQRRMAAAAAAAKRMETSKAEQEAAAKAAEPKPETAPASEPVAEQEPDSAANASSSETPQNDPRLNVNLLFLTQMVDDMGFPKVRAQKALILTGNKSVEQAVEWCFEHADDPDIDEALQIVTKEGEPKPKLSQEEAKKRADELYARARAKREAQEKKEVIEREKERLKSGKEAGETKKKLEEESRRRAVEEKRREKREALAERKRVRAMLEADKKRRHEKFHMPGDPPATQAEASSSKPKPKPVDPSAAAGKIQFRMPDGSRVEGEFTGDQTMDDIIYFLMTARPELSSRTLTFSQQYPRKVYTQNEYGMSLADLKLLPRAALSVSYS